jgi:hypothetical protein
MIATDIDSLAHDARTLDTKEFARRHAPFFFVALGLEVQKTRVPMATHRYEPRPPQQRPETTARVAIAALEEAASLPAKGASMLRDLRFFPVRRLPTSQFPFVSIGRLEGNDIALGDPTVSKFHAYLKADDDGAFVLLQDGRSQNGTFVDGSAVAQRHVAAPTLLVSGQNVRFGSVSLTYLDAASVMRLVQTAVDAPAPAFA